MRRLASGFWLIALITVAVAGAVLPGTAQAAPAHAAATKWTKISTDTSLGIASAGGFGSPGRSTWRPNLPPRLRQ